MLAAGYDTALLWVDKKKKDWQTHVMGGIPAIYFPQWQGQTWHANSDLSEEWVAIELTGDQGWKPGQPVMGKDYEQTVFAIEVLRAPE